MRTVTKETKKLRPIRLRQIYLLSCFSVNSGHHRAQNRLRFARRPRLKLDPLPQPTAPIRPPPSLNSLNLNFPLPHSSYTTLSLDPPPSIPQCKHPQPQPRPAAPPPAYPRSVSAAARSTPRKCYPSSPAPSSAQVPSACAAASGPAWAWDAGWV